MSQKDQLLHFSKLLSYPGIDYRHHLQGLLNTFEVHSEAGQRISEFSARIAEWGNTQLEESFSNTFDLNPRACLDVGWHLFGEDYKRGQFLVRMRQALKEHDLSESVELPDHISHCLQLLSELDEEDTTAFVENYLFPALQRILSGLPQDNAFKPLVEALRDLLVEGYDGKLEEIGRDARLPVLNGPRHLARSAESITDQTGS